MQVITQERGSQQWREAHRNRVSASDAGAILAAPGTKKRAKLVDRLVLDREVGPLHTDEFPEPWDEQHEVDLRSALAAYRKDKAVVFLGYEVQDVGLCGFDSLDWLAATPDALVDTDGCVRFRIRKSLRSFREKQGLTNADRARAQLTMLVCDRMWCDVVDFYDGAGEFLDLEFTQRVAFDYGWLLANVFPRLVSLWEQVRAALKARDGIRAR